MIANMWGWVVRVLKVLGWPARVPEPVEVEWERLRAAGRGLDGSLQDAALSRPGTAPPADYWTMGSDIQELKAQDDQLLLDLGRAKTENIKLEVELREARRQIRTELKAELVLVSLKILLDAVQAHPEITAYDAGALQKQQSALQAQLASATPGYGGLGLGGLLAGGKAYPGHWVGWDL